MSDILKEIGGYLEDASVIMSKRVVADVVDEIARLRVERDELRELLREARDEMREHELWVNLRARIDAALNKGGE